MAPKHKVPYGVGVVLSATLLGFTVGPLLGGLLIDSIGFRATFLTAGALAALAGIVVRLFLRESFQRPEGQEKLDPRSIFGGLAQAVRSKALAPALLLVFLAQAGPTMMILVLPLFLATLPSSGDGASGVGLAFAIMGLAGGVSAIVMGGLSQRVGLVRMLTGSFLAAGVLYLALLLVGDLGHAYVILAVLGFFNGGLSALAFSVVGTSAAADKQGAAYGAAQSVSSLAWGGAPLLGGAIAGLWGIREVFLLNSIALLVAGVLVSRLYGRELARAATQEVEATPAGDPAGAD